MTPEIRGGVTRSVSSLLRAVIYRSDNIGTVFHR